MSEKAVLRIECVHDARLCYAMQQNAVPLVPLLVVHNDGDAEVRDVEVRVALQPDLAAVWSARIAAIAPAGSARLTEVRVEPRPEALANCTERQRANLRVEVHGGGALLAAKDHAVEVLAYNEWPGAASPPELLAAFVLPNHPALAPVLRDAASRLAAATGSAALEGYRARDRVQALAQAQAVYDALMARGIAYVHPPASFEQHGQKVRTPEQVLHERLGTCVDLAVLYAACLEQIGMHALLVVTEGHALAGVWLEDEVFAEAAPADPLPLRKRVELERIALVECTTLCSTQVQPFAAAAEIGARAVAADAPFLFAVDVAMARRAGVRPLPLRTTAFVASEPEPEPVPAAAPPEPPPPVVPAPMPMPIVSRADEDRLARWQRRLLDVSLRNRLLNFTPTKRSLPLLAPDVEAWVATLSGGASFQVLPQPALAATADTTALPTFLRQQLQGRRLHAALAPEELDRRLLEIFRQARTANEESGVNTLFLAVGFLRWYETPQSQEPRRAPLWLLPLRIERVSLAEGFVVALADEEARVNETLVQKLHRDFGIGVALPEADDDEGPSVATVLEAFRRAVVDVERWEVEATAWIGCFSFAKYLMWVDLAERRADLLEHGLVRHLVETPEQSFTQADDEWPEASSLDGIDPGQLLCPLDADSSQLCAVLAAAAGRSFVLEGPPGTGKSQTIANLIAQCLAQGQRVLFVAEKRAALEVVQRRLAAAGLAPFCLELHSGKGQKRDVVQQLGRALELVQQGEPEQWQEQARELAEVRAQLNRHVAAVHSRREPGTSVFAATALVVGARELPQIDGLPIELDAAGLQQRRAAVAALAGSAAPLGELRQHPWYGVRRPDWQPSLAAGAAALQPRIEAAVAAAARAYAAAGQALQLAGDVAGAGRARLEALAELAAAVAAGPLPLGLLTAVDFAARCERALNWIALGERAAAAWSELQPRWRPELLQLDVAGLHSKLLRLQHRFWLLRWWKLRPVRAALRAVAIGDVPAGKALHADLEGATALAQLRTQLQAVHAEATATFGEGWRGGDSDFGALRAQCERAAIVHAHSALVAKGAEGAAALLHRCGELAGKSPELTAVAAPHGELRAALQALATPLQLCFDRAFGAAEEDSFLPRVTARMRAFVAAPGRLREQCAFQRDAAAARALGLEPLESALEDARVAAAQLPAVFERSFAESWLQALMQREPELQAFSGLDHQRRIDRFRALDEDLIALAGKVVSARLSAALPALRRTGAESSELGVLLRELKKQRRHLPPRQLFARIPHLLTRLSPCLLMSPLTVAQVLGRRLPPFDVVVFDEASQVPVWDAVGAIGRGRSLVVVGDSRQLPPTQFFQRLDGDDADADVPSESVEELESVLDECGAAGLQRLHLRWHYRSRHESLIAFSNHHYYENRLLTLPAPDSGAPNGGQQGVRLVPIEGVYDRSRSQTNRLEAEALVRELVARLRDPATAQLTYGVVTFSQPQQELVEDLLEQQRREHPEIEQHFGQDDEPVFVKNLENVQGDERDVMLFSICYGPDAAGKVHMNFGPLNLQGGERRLNVAITRARRQLLVFSSLQAGQIELQRTQSLGVRHLRSFLDYAARGAPALALGVAGETGAVESPFERAVLRALERRGHEVHAQVGCSGYRIDLAIVDPRSKGRYLLGVECDGASYHSAATARDRDRLRQSVLERLGWRLCRVWSTDWWLDEASELQRLDAAIEAALQAPVAPAPKLAAPAGPVTSLDGAAAAASTAHSTGDTKVELPSPSRDRDEDRAADNGVRPDAPPYVIAALPPAGDSDAFHEQRHTARVREQVATVLAQEAPIKLELLSRRVAEAWGIGRTTERVRERVRAALPEAAHVRDGVLWPAGQDPAAWRGFRTSPAGEAARDAELLPVVEIECAAAWVLHQHGSIGEDDLLRETARQFGFARLGTAVRAAMLSGLERLLERGEAQREDGLVRPGPDAPSPTTCV